MLLKDIYTQKSTFLHFKKQWEFKLLYYVPTLAMYVVWFRVFSLSNFMLNSFSQSLNEWMNLNTIVSCSADATKAGTKNHT